LTKEVPNAFGFDRAYFCQKFDARRGARTSLGKSSDLPSEVELILLSSLRIENRVIGRVIGL
jgi:hypothetical protein